MRRHTLINVVGGIAGGLAASFAMEWLQRGLGRTSHDIGGAPTIHYAFGGALGAIYGAAAARTPDITAGGGLPFGASVWLIADELGMPMAGLAKAPTEYPLKDHLTTFASHLVFGALTDGVRRGVVTTLRK